MPDPLTQLPKEIPQDLRDFVRCRANAVDIDRGDLDWLPKPEGMPIPDVTPGLTFENGPTPGTITILVGWGFFSVPLTVSVTDGALTVDPPPIPGLGDQITDWVNNLNADLKANEMQFEGAVIRNGKLHLSKQPIPAVVTETSVPDVPTMVAVSPPTTTPSGVLGPNPTEGATIFHDHWKKIGVGALALGVAAFFLFGSNEDPLVIESSPVTQEAGDPATEAGETETPSEDVVTPDEEPNPPETEEPENTEPGTDNPLGAWFGELDDFAEDRAIAGTLVMIQPDTAGDHNYCGENASVGADITGIVLATDGQMSTAAVRMAQSPMTSVEDFSNAVTLQLMTESGSYRSFIWEIHNGDVLIGEQMLDGTMDTESDVAVTVDESGVFFAFTSDPSDPFFYAMAQGFNLPQDGDNIGCDLAYAAASPSPPPPSDHQGCTESDGLLCVNDRFSAQVVDPVTGDTASAMSIDADSGFFHFFDVAEPDVMIRVINGCEFDNHYWVFAAGLTDVNYSLTVTDTETDMSQTFEPGDASQPIQDTTAFATCP